MRLSRLAAAAASLASFAVALPVLAIETGLEATAQEAGFVQPGGESTPLLEVVGSFIQAGLGLLGVAFLLMGIFAGWKYLTAQGDAKEAAKGMQILQTAVIGIIIIFSAYAISTFIIGAVLRSTGIEAVEDTSAQDDALNDQLFAPGTGGI
jgi:hypothetical protein